MNPNPEIPDTNVLPGDQCWWCGEAITYDDIALDVVAWLAPLTGPSLPVHEHCYNEAMDRVDARADLPAGLGGKA